MTTEQHFYKNNPEWSDIKPLSLPQQPGDPFLVDYTESYVDMMGYFFAVLEKKEISKRALEITEKVIKILPAHYTAWWYKYYILENLGFDFNFELEYLNNLIKVAPKSYQAWHYRQWILKKAIEIPNEFLFLMEIFNIDSKNFHAWSYSIWYANEFNKHEEIYELSLKQIEIDLRNNSAWNTRFTIGIILNKNPKLEILDAMNSLMIIGKNEAPINFIFGYIEKYSNLEEDLIEFSQKFLNKNINNQFAYRILLFIETGKNNNNKIIELCDKLIELDNIREPYYNLIKEGKIKYR